MARTEYIWVCLKMGASHFMAVEWNIMMIYQRVKGYPLDKAILVGGISTRIYPSKPPTSIYPVCLDFCLVLMAFTEGVRAAGPWGTQRSSRVLRENLRAQYFMNTPFTLFVANTLLWHLAHPLQSGSFGITLDIIIWITRASCFVFPNHIASREASRSPICQVQM